jgi:hypothetical protein
MSASPPAAPGLVYAFEERVALSPPLVIGPVPAGLRRIIPIAAGTFEGPGYQGEGLAGKIVPGGADWQILRNDFVDELQARYTLETNRGELIYVMVQGIRTGPEEVMLRLRAGEVVDPSLYYFRGSAILETSAPDLGWMTRSAFVIGGERYPSEVVIRFWRVL